MIPYIPSYYALAYLAHADWDRAPSAMTELERLSKEMALCFRDYLYMASLGESRHSWSKIGRGFQKFNGTSRDQIYSRCVKFACSPENMTILRGLFDEDGWGENPGYGGGRWARIVELAMQYGTMSDVLYVDAVVNAQHNGGTAFSKSEASEYMDIQFGVDMQTLRKFLDFRRDTKDFLGGMMNYFNNYSITAGRLVIDYSDRYHGGMVVRTMTPMRDKTYKPVKWGNEPLPKIMSREDIASCSTCGSGKGVKKCKKCSWYLCPSCMEQHMPEYHKETYRCPGCLEIVDHEDMVVSSCGVSIHANCLYEHSKTCPLCYDNYDKISHGFDVCVVCKYPIHDSIKNWHVYKGEQRCHKHCYHLHIPNGGPSNTDFKASKMEFDEYMVKCVLCGKPSAESSSVTLSCQSGEHDSGLAHPFCYTAHELSCVEDALNHCNCGECAVNRERVKLIMAKEAKQNGKEGKKKND